MINKITISDKDQEEWNFVLDSFFFDKKYNFDRENNLICGGNYLISPRNRQN
jgi:hypothetical protein